jgi:hypothetical protein
LEQLLEVTGAYLKAEIGFPEEGYWEAFPELVNDFIETSKFYVNFHHKKQPSIVGAISDHTKSIELNF